MKREKSIEKIKEKFDSFIRMIEDSNNVKFDIRASSMEAGIKSLRITLELE